jgi:UDP-N-acetylmuramoyl-L-alanyl-D-glutamate--2,6-diaminopimelate ligase
VPTKTQAATDSIAPARGAVISTRGMRLADILAGVTTTQPLANAAREVTGIAYDSRHAVPGSAFFAIRGESTDGNRFISDAIRRGASVVVSELPRPVGENSADVAWVQVPEARKALAIASANFFGHPTTALKLIAITGTAGKTTTSFLLDSILQAAGITTGLFGTVVYRTPRSEVHATNTTPESYEMQRFFAELRDAGGVAGILEASSHALSMDRLWSCHFDVAVFTNLTSDHLDYHKNVDDYFAAKRRLFEGTGAGAPGTAVLNSDDARSRQLHGLAKRTLTFGLDEGAEVTTKKFELAFSGLQFTADTPDGKIDVRSTLVGRTNVYNILAAVAAAQAIGISRATIETGISALPSVPGRFERIDCGQPFLVIVDYEHTDDSLRKLLVTARELHPEGRIITLFGNGGDRDRTKRPAMGETAARASDLVILTVDNPRSEDPLRTINDAVVGIQRTRTPYRVEPDRERAIALAYAEARPGDIVLLVGKGHETYQVMKDGPVYFNEREVARRLLLERGYGKGIK